MLATADESLDRLAHLVDNLLDMSRLQAGALSVFPRPAGLEEIIARSLDDLGPDSRAVAVEIPESLPEVRVDPAILERVIVNLTGTRCGTPRQARRRCSPPAPWAARSSCAWSTAAPASRRRTGTGCSARSSGSVTPTTPRVSD